MEFPYKIQSSDDKISYTLVSLIMYDGDSLNCGQYVNDVFDNNTGIWLYCGDEDITEIGGLPEGVYIR